MQTVIWDWNGTLLNDLDFCIKCINQLLKKRGIEDLSVEMYKAVFSFPIKNYYKAIGFDFTKEDFEIPAREFIDIYNKGIQNCSLHNYANELLAHFKAKGFRQFVLSAMQHKTLEKTLKQQGIYNYFEAIAGLDNHYAISKIERGEALISAYKIEKEKALIIGDTIHDFEVAKRLDIECILVASGHQSFERLKDTGAKVIQNLKALKEHL